MGQLGCSIVVAHRSSILFGRSQVRILAVSYNFSGLESIGWPCCKNLELRPHFALFLDMTSELIYFFRLSGKTLIGPTFVSLAKYLDILWKTARPYRSQIKELFTPFFPILKFQNFSKKAARRSLKGLEIQILRNFLKSCFSDKVILE